MTEASNATELREVMADRKIYQERWHTAQNEVERLRGELAMARAGASFHGSEIAEAERRGAAKALRSACRVWYSDEGPENKLSVMRWFARRADAIENGADL